MWPVQCESLELWSCVDSDRCRNLPWQRQHLGWDYLPGNGECESWQVAGVASHTNTHGSCSLFWFCSTTPISKWVRWSNPQIWSECCDYVWTFQFKKRVFGAAMHHFTVLKPQERHSVDRRISILFRPEDWKTQPWSLWLFIEACLFRDLHQCPGRYVCCTLACLLVTWRSRGRCMCPCSSEQ